MSALKTECPECYRGWTIRRGPAHPVTGAWRASRYGVGMGSGTLEQLLRMIDVRNAEEQSARAQRQHSRGQS